MMVLIVRFLLPALSVFAVIYFFILPQDLENKSSFVEKSEDSNTEEQLIQKVHLIESKGHRKIWELWADRAYEYKGKDTWELEGVRAHFLSEEGGSFRVRGERGTVEIESKNMGISGKVVILSENGYQFSTKAIKYEASVGQLLSSSSVQMRGPEDSKKKGMLLTGDQMIITVKNSLMRILKNVKAEKRVNDKYEVRIRSQEAEFSGKAHSADFFKKVIINIEKTRLMGERATFKYGILSKNTGIKGLKSILVSGGVKAVGTDKFVTAGELDFSFAENKFTFTGQPKVVKDNDELRGNKIIFLDGGKKIRVYKARARVDRKVGRQQ